MSSKIALRDHKTKGPLSKPRLSEMDISHKVSSSETLTANSKTAGEAFASEDGIKLNEEPTLLATRSRNRSAGTTRAGLRRNTSLKTNTASRQNNHDKPVPLVSPTMLKSPRRSIWQKVRS